MADFDPDSKPRERRGVIIEDLRHNRDVEDIEEEKAAAAESAVTEPDVKEVVHELHAAETEKAAEALEEFPVAATGAEGALGGDVVPGVGDQSGELGSLQSQAAEQGGHAAEPGEAEYSEEEIRAIEREQLRQIIGLGLVNYLKYQLTMVLNFALLSLGSAPDPVTGIVSKNLPQAKLAIDVLEFMVARLQNEMSVAERQQMAQLVSDLKYSFMQAAADGTPPAGMPGGAAGEA